MILEKCKKNKKGSSDFGMTGTILVVAIAIIVGLILFTATAQQIGESVNTVTVNNRTITAPAVGGVYNITDFRSISSFSMVNTTGGQIAGSTNYTIANNQISPTTGALQSTITMNSTASTFAGIAVNISFVGQPLTYIDDSGGRAVTNIILIFLAIAIALVALYPLYGNQLRDLLGI